MTSAIRKSRPDDGDLFGADPARPEGLHYASDFISEAEEASLIEAIAGLKLAPFQFGAFEGKRRVVSFGFRYDFSDQSLHEAEPVPEFIRPLAERAEAFAELAPGAVRHVLFTEYGAGAGIGWHRDKADFDIVLGISLGSACPVRFRRKHETGWQRYTIDASERSIYVLSGEVRSAWEHSIAPVIEPRWSITFRTMA